MLFTQSCPILCDPMDCSLPGSSVHGILQARILEWVAIPFSRGSYQPRDQTQVSCIAGRFFTIWPPGKPICNGLHSYFSKEDTWVADKPMKAHSTSLGKYRSKPQWDYDTPTRIAVIFFKDIQLKYCWKCGQSEILMHCWWERIML